MHAVHMYANEARRVANPRVINVEMVDIFMMFSCKTY